MGPQFSYFSLISSLFLVLVFNKLAHSKVAQKVRCLDDVMLVDLVKTDSITNIYLDQLKNYPDEECHAKMEGNHARFHLSLVDIHRCGVTRISNEMTGSKVFYHKIVVEHDGAPPLKEYILVKCSTNNSQNNHTVSKRNVLPAGFTEPEDLEVTTTLTGKAPEPMLNVGVRQGNQPVSGELNVNPGTPLTMEIYLDKTSAPVYGVLVSYMQVTDTKQQEETIIFNGCSVDPYLFENFNTINGDFLSAKFRAFKFPDSTYVQFRGTVNVCLDKCSGVDCSNGQTGFGRKRRQIPEMPADPNKLFEVSLTTFIKINFLDSNTEDLRSREQNETEGLFILKEHIVPTRKSFGMETNGNGVEGINSQHSPTIGEKLQYSVVLETNTNASFSITSFNILILLLSFSLYFLN